MNARTIVENKRLTTDEKIRAIMELARRDAVKIQHRKEAWFVGRLFKKIQGLFFN